MILFFFRNLIYDVRRGSRSLKKVEIDLKMIQTHSKPSLPHSFRGSKGHENSQKWSIWEGWVRDCLEWICSPDGEEGGMV